MPTAQRQGSPSTIVAKNTFLHKPKFGWPYTPFQCRFCLYVQVDGTSDKKRCPGAASSGDFTVLKRMMPGLEGEDYKNRLDPVATATKYVREIGPYAR
jgi:hypothetical protein